MGVGNLLMRDEGVGVHAVRAIEKLGLPPSVQVIDAGTAALDALSVLGSGRRLVVVDAVRGGGEPGTLYRLSPKDIAPATGAPISLHDMGVREALTAAEILGRKPRSTVIIGVEPETIAWGLHLSPTVKAAIPAVVNLVLREISGSAGEAKGGEHAHLRTETTGGNPGVSGG